MLAAMCGIGSIVRFTRGETAPPLLPARWIRALDSGIEHRGRDGSGVMLDRVKVPQGWIDVALVHHRLSILDHAGGAQPMVDPPALGGLSGESELTRLEPDALAVVFNGCIYNHRELRRELAARGARFQSDHSDTEVLLHGYRLWGRELPERLEGMFAFVIWDRRCGDVFAARDRAGEKPLVSARAELAYGWVSIHASTESAVAMTMAAAGGECSWSGVGPSVRMGWSEGPLVGGGRGIRGGEAANGDAIASYWQASADRRGGALHSEHVDALVGQAVAERLDADVPLACLLSGGVDSSLVAAHAKRLKPDLKTFCVRMPEARYDESGHAAAVAKHLGTDHTTLECDARPVEDLERLIGQMGVPFGDSSILPTYWVCKAVREHARVALSGDGGDELFGGYERYVVALWPDEVKQAIAALPTGVMEGAHPKSRVAKLARLAKACRGAGYGDLLAIFPSWLGGAERSAAIWPVDPLREDFDGELPGDILRKVDTASMAAGVEVRAPLLATAIIEAAFATPLDVLMPRRALGGRRLKALLKDALARHVPRGLFERPKSGFAIPIGAWIREDFGGLGTAVGDVVHSASPWATGEELAWLDGAMRRRLWDEHQSGRRDHGARLFQMLTLHFWDRWKCGLGSAAAERHAHGSQ
jgi:asparagine synthase (glutamine-hydrolysing)